jgi:hypothetical protein
MLKKINGVEIIQFKEEDKIWYSYLKGQLDEVDFGCVEVKLTIKNTKVVALKVTKENTYNLHNA